jgi:hypothetical protein
MAQLSPERTALYAWLDSTIDALPNTGQVVLNFDGTTVRWEIKAAYSSHDRNGDLERTEVRRFGRLAISRREPKIAP